MLCEKCGKNNATVHIHSVVNGVVSEKNLCGYCAASENSGEMVHNSLGQMLASMFGDTLSISQGNTVKCPCCNSTFSDIAKTGKVGCSKCYEIFKEELLPNLKKIHGSTEHIGIIPNKGPLVVKNEIETAEELKLKLAQLIAVENFEEAAIVRDKIKELERKEIL